MLNEQIKLIVVDDHPGVRKGIINILKAAPDIEVVGEAGNGKQAISLALTKNPHLILLDVELPDFNGDIVLQRIQKLLPDTKVLAISAHSDRQYVLGMRENGASGYLTKDTVPAMLVNAIRGIINDGVDWIGPRIISDDSPYDPTLTQKEIEILKQFMLDQSEYAIASNLDMEENRVRQYLELLKKKYNVKSLSALKGIARQIFSNHAS